MKTKLDEAREVINEVDEQMIQLFIKRMAAVSMVAEYKAENSLPVFDMYATLNNVTEVNFYVINGKGTFTFDSGDYSAENNEIDISIGSLINSTSRTFKVTYAYKVPNSEIPA
jgi:GTP-sensing pleiotropic transcriptional regulator CodY